MNSLRLALCQINPVVGDLPGNAARILADLEKAREAGAQIVVFPEMSLTGYPPEDLLLKTDFIQAAASELTALAARTDGITAVFGTIHHDRDLFNAAVVAHDGHIAAVYHKRFLPNYGVFDENRYFRAGRRNMVFDRDGFRFGVSVCEDIWYPGGPPAEQAIEGEATLLINISASPYHMGKGAARERMLATRAADNTAFVAYCNLVGGQDELVFDGHSLVVGPKGEVLARGVQFDEDFLVVDIDSAELSRARAFDPRRRQWRPSFENIPGEICLPPLPERSASLRATKLPEQALGRLEEVRRALVLGTRDYVRKSGFAKVVIGLSGGVDSALTAVLAAEALGAENVTGVAMPSRYSSDHSITDAKALAENLGIGFMMVGMDQLFSAFLDALDPAFAGRESGLAEENLQPRIRGTLLMALSNKFGWLVLTTGNKSEGAVGYSTLYGDTAGGFAVIKDLPKTLVYELCRHINALDGREIIPESVLTKPPSAELRPDQKDSDSLPPYEILDPILGEYVEGGLGPAEIVARGACRETVEAVVGLVDRNEYKRRQSPPGVKITPRAFGKDWRLPLVNRFRSGS